MVRAPLGQVDVQVENALLGEQQLQPQGEICLDTLAHERAAVPEEDVLRHLLRQRAGAAQLPPTLASLQCLVQLHEVDAVVEVEAVVLGGEHGASQRRAHRAAGHRRVYRPRGRLTGGKPLHGAAHHDHGDRRVHHGKEQNEGNGGQSHEQQHAQQPHDPRATRLAGCPAAREQSHQRAFRVRAGAAACRAADAASDDAARNTARGIPAPGLRAAGYSAARWRPRRARDHRWG